MVEAAKASMVQHFERNTVGRDFAVGDIHGHFTRLQAALDAAGFDPAADRLFSVGDVVDRGPESAQVLEWLERPWFHAVQGNHEDIAARYVRERSIGAGQYTILGGAWLMDLPDIDQMNIAAALAALPVVIEVETHGGLVGIVHADCPLPTWAQCVQFLEHSEDTHQEMKDLCLWSRSRIDKSDASGVPDLRALVVGHTPLRHPALLGNVYHIDTGGWLRDGHFTLLNLDTLQSIPPMRATLQWEESEASTTGNSEEPRQ